MLVSKLNNSDFAKAVEAEGSEVRKHGVGEQGRRPRREDGRGVGNWNEEAATEFKVGSKTFKPDKFAKSAEDEFDHAAGAVAGKDAGNKVRATIDRDISASRETGINQIADNRNDDGFVPKENRDISRAASAPRRQPRAQRREGRLEYRKGQTARRRRSSAQRRPHREAQKEGHEEDKNIEDWRKDPKKFQEETELKRVEADIAENRTEGPEHHR